MLLNNLFSRVLMSEERESFYRSLEDEAFVIFFSFFSPLVSVLAQVLFSIERSPLKRYPTIFSPKETVDVS